MLIVNTCSTSRSFRTKSAPNKSQLVCLPRTTFTSRSRHRASGLQPQQTLALLIPTGWRINWCGHGRTNKRGKMKERYFNDLKIGDRFQSEPLSITEKEVIEFAHKFDPQMFHLN